METVPKMISPTRPERKVGKQHQSTLENWTTSGRPPKGFYSYKLEFGAEILRNTPPTILSDSTTFSRRKTFRDEIKQKQSSKTIERKAFHVQGLQTDGQFEPILWSEDLTVSVAGGSLDQVSEQHAYRHADAHELFFVHRTSEEFDVLTDFGVLTDIQEGDFLYMPQGVTYTFCNTQDVTMLCYESDKPIYRPYDYWMGDQQPWPFPPTAPNPPEPAPPESIHEEIADVSNVVLKRRQGDYTQLTYDTPVFDAVAWEGSIWPFQLHLDDMNALTSPDFHVDPSKVTAFVSEDEGMSLQVFLPRWMQSPPYNHMNQVEEALLNHRGYQARPEIQDGYLTLHPSGVPHGPDPEVVKDLAEKPAPDPSELPWADEIGVMVETQSPFMVLESGTGIEVGDYDESWEEQYQSK